MPISFPEDAMVCGGSHQGQGRAVAGHLALVSIMVETRHPVGTPSVLPAGSSRVLRRH